MNSATSLRLWQHSIKLTSSNVRLKCVALLLWIWLGQLSFYLCLSSAAPHQFNCFLNNSALDFTGLRPDVAYVNSDANVFFTLLFSNYNCHSKSTERRDYAIFLNAAKHALNLLNNISSPANQDEHSPVKQFFPLFQDVPFRMRRQIKYGVKIISFNNDQSNASISSLFNLKCHELDSNILNGTIQDLAVLGDTHLIEKHIGPEIPTISLSPKRSFLTTSFKSNLIISLFETLKWRHFAIMTTKDEDSLQIAEILGLNAHYGVVCISDIFEWVNDTNEDDSMVDYEDDSLESKQSLKERLNIFLSSIYNANKKIPILVMNNNEKQVGQMATMLYEEFQSKIGSHQFVFALVPSPDLLAKLQQLSKWTTVYILTSQFPSIPQLGTEEINKPKGCANSMENKEPALDNELWHKWLSFLPIRSILSVSMALNLALDDQCANHTDKLLCSQFTNLERKSFFKYLSQVDDKSQHSLMSVGAVDPSGNITDLLLFESDKFVFKQSDNVFAPSSCSHENGDCNSCVNFRETRNDAHQFDDIKHQRANKVLGYNSHNDLHVLLNGEESSVPVEMDEEIGDISLMHVETHEINLGLLLPLHQNGASILECSSDLNLPSYYIYEAARWIIDKINLNNYLIPGIEIKLELIDTCSSPFYATQELAHLTSSEAKVQPIAFVSAIPKIHYKQIVDFISSINYTLIATEDISVMDLKFGAKYGVLQTAVTRQSLIRAMVEQLKYFGWRYVSVVIEPHDKESMSMFNYLNELTTNEKICFASVERVTESNINSTVNRLLDNSNNGANIVILLTNFVTTANLMNFYHSINKFGHQPNENLHFLVLRDPNLEMVHGFEEEFMGSIFIRESIGSINHFDNFFLETLANPKKEQLLYQFIKQCGSNSAQCLQTISLFDRTVAANTMQGILAIIGGFARMRNETCSNEQGICSKMLEYNFHEKLLSYILNTRSMRIDSQLNKRFKSENYDVYEFNNDGSSGRDIEILNFKHDFTNGLFRFDTAALYNHNIKTIMKNPNVRYIFYKFNGLVNGQKEYNETEFMTSDCISIKKCNQCEPQSPEFIYMPSWDNLIITGVFDVHSHSAQNPLICEKNKTIHSNVQNVEAFLWTIDLINSDPNILPGVHLGALIFDTCSSYQKIYRDISNFLSNSLLLGDSNVRVPTAESVVGFVVDGKNTKIVDSILDLTNPLKLSVLASQIKESKYNDINHYSQFLGFSLPNNFYVDSILNILKKYSWKFVSVLYENDNSLTHQYFDAFEYFKANMAKYGIQISTKELFSETSLDETITNLKTVSNIGSKVLILFVSPENLRKFLHYNSLINDTEKKLLPHEVIYISIESSEIFQEFSKNNLSVISVSQEKKVIPEFEEHFLDLTLKTNLKNPWFAKLWEKVFKCQGFSCYRTTGSLRDKNVQIDSETTAIINSVFALARGLELIRQRRCPQSYNGLCSDFHKQASQLSKLEHDVIKENAFVGLDGNRIYFNPQSNYITNHLNVQNLQLADVTSFNWLNIGRFDVDHGLIMSSSKSKVYLKDGSSTTLNKIVSICQDVNRCAKTLKETSEVQHLLMIPSDDVQATIALILPLHRLESHKLGNYTCGPINIEIFEKLLSFYYSLEKVNRDSGMNLGVMVLDTCAYNKQFSRQLSSIKNYKLLPKIVSIISLLENSHSNQVLSNELYNSISDYNPFVYNFYRPKFEVQQNLFFNQLSENNGSNNQMIMLRSIVDLCSKNKWLVVNLVYTNEFNKNYFTFEANKNNICVDKVFEVTTKDIASTHFKSDWNNFSKSMDSHVVVILSNSDIIEFLVKYSERYMLDNFIWIGDKNLKTAQKSAMKNFRKNSQNIIILKHLSQENSYSHLELNSAMEDFSKYFDINNQRVKNRILNNWLHQYWQRKFNCFPNSKEHDPKCFESEYARKALINVKEMKHLMDFVKVLGSTISKFVDVKCKNSSKEQADDSCLFNYHLRNELKNNIIDDLNSNNYINDLKKVDTDSHYEIEVLSNFGKTVNIFNSYHWRNLSSLIIGQNSEISTNCKISCDFCAAQLLQSKNKSNSLLFSDGIQSPLSSNVNYHRNLGIAVSILSTLGLIVVLICVLYFILIFPVALGTTIIGYQILIGLFFCYLVDFAYLLPNTYTLCWLRQFGLPVAYAVILSGLFVKVYNYWCQMAMKKTNESPKYNSQCILLTISFIFIIAQVSITLFNLYKYPPNPGIISNLMKCSAASGKKFLFFNIEEVLPLIILGVLFAWTLIFAIKTASNLESKWILICCILTAVTWATWLGGSILYKENSMSIVIANMVNATIFIVFLYLRKLYLFSKISRNILKERRFNMEGNMQYEPFADYHQQYGAFKPAADNISWGTAKGVPRNATRSPFETDNEDNVSSCGSVKSSTSQVQCQELYPMDVYDNQLNSQTQTNSRIGHSTRSVYDIIDDGNMK